MVKSGINCHKSLEGVMSNYGFGNIKVFDHKRGVLIELSQRHVNKKNGYTKKYIHDRLKNLSIENLLFLEKEGVSVTTL